MQSTPLQTPGSAAVSVGANVVLGHCSTAGTALLLPRGPVEWLPWLSPPLRGFPQLTSLPNSSAGQAVAKHRQADGSDVRNGIAKRTGHTATVMEAPIQPLPFNL